MSKCKFSRCSQRWNWNLRPSQIRRHVTGCSCPGVSKRRSGLNLTGRMSSHALRRRHNPAELKTSEWMYIKMFSSIAFMALQYIFLLWICAQPEDVFYSRIVLLMITYGCVYSYCTFILFTSSWGGHPRHATLQRRSQHSSVNDPDYLDADFYQT